VRHSGQLLACAYQRNNQRLGMPAIRFLGGNLDAAPGSLRGKAQRNGSAEQQRALNGSCVFAIERTRPSRASAAQRAEAVLANRLRSTHSVGDGKAALDRKCAFRLCHCRSMLVVANDFASAALVRTVHSTRLLRCSAPGGASSLDRPGDGAG